MDAAVDASTSQFELTEEQRAIQEMAQAFAADRVAPNALDWDRRKHFPTDVIRETGPLGLGGIYIRDDVGGSALGRLDAVLIFEALSHADPAFSSFISIHNMVASMIDRFGNEEQRQRFLPKLTSMEWLASYCLTEPGSGSDAAALKTRAVKSGGDYVLNGAKQFISGAGDSDVYAVMVRTGADGPKGISTIVVPKDAPGLSFGANEHKMGWHMQSTRQVIFEDCKVPAENLLSGEGAGFGIAMAGLDGGRLNIAACSLGGAQSALDKALAYTAERKAFGSKINQFQALQFRLADMETELQAARIFLYAAASKLDRKAPDAGKWSAMAKRFVTDTGFNVANDALQLLGGYGYLHDYGIEKLVRDLRVHQILEGTNEIMRVIIARALIGR
ncbi:MAG: acyl-CoA dehydrogenase [Mesorhizobium sp.]|uniref:isobutyryl-CoA dehydrogenase n=1 Tax=Mesorhizobium sp. TaxID=1871066 RepID=UPI000FD30ED3|nr:isobutyryl-CoA dehydrogenase [Mesorhizobium sp.]RVD50574.1 acyl-CoA dehydrogenase [Mesorhizobium sp. M8A.F.Ca.ET.023.02.2.1]RWC72460.1 MAG: acyl-CoA dehydrogenase [Mesorhizobium sp.]RWC89613.1 MAG: acyl-CoA dehydrogenase [Mesorhizobium sp.]